MNFFSFRSQSRDMLSLKCRIFLIKEIFKNLGEYSQNVQQAFIHKFPSVPVPHRNTVRRLIRKFRETGSVADASRAGRPKVLTEEKVTEIAAKVEASRKKSIRRLSQQADVSYGSAHKALKKLLHLKPYKVTLVHELKEPDKCKRMRYCQWLRDFVEEHGEDIFDHTFFTDKAWFHLSGYVNSQNC